MKHKNYENAGSAWYYSNRSEQRPEAAAEDDGYDFTADSIDLNAFQHRIYLQSEIDQYGYKIQNIGNTLIAARTEDLSDPRLVAAYSRVVDAFHSQGTKDVFEKKLGGYYLPVGWDEDLLADYR